MVHLSVALVVIICCLFSTVATVISAQETTSLSSPTPTIRSTLAPVTTPEVTTTRPPLPISFSWEAEGTARGTLSTLALIVAAPIVGPSAIFDVARALSVFTFARCEHADAAQAHYASTNPMPWPEAVIPILSGGSNNGWHRGTVISNLFIAPLIVAVLSLSYGYYKVRDIRQRQGRIAARAGSTASFNNLHNDDLPAELASKPWSQRIREWYYLVACNYMYHGSFITCICVTFAFGFDGSISAAASMFATKTESADTDKAGDFMCVLFYILIVGFFLHRTANVVYLSTPARFFTTPGALRKKPGKRPRRRIKPWLGDMLDGAIGTFCVLGHFVWRCSSSRTFRQLRECQALFRRFHGPRDEDRAALASKIRKEQAEQQGVTMTVSVSDEAMDEQHLQEQDRQQNNDGAVHVVSRLSDRATDNDSVAGFTEQQYQPQQQKEPEFKMHPILQKLEDAENEAAAETAAGTAANENKREQQKKPALPVTNKKSLQTVSAPSSGPSWLDKLKEYNWRLLFLRLCCTCFFFIEFIGVFFIALLKGLARVSESPSACHSLAMAAAILNLLHLIFVLAVRPFIVPVRNVMAVASATVTVAAHFLVAESMQVSNKNHDRSNQQQQQQHRIFNAKQTAIDLSLFAAIIPLVAFVFTGVPRLTMRFMWALQHAPAPAKTIPLPDPKNQQQLRQQLKEGKLTPAEIHKKKEEQRLKLAKARGDVYIPMLPPQPRASIAEPQRHEPEAAADADAAGDDEEANQEKSDEELAAEAMLLATAGPLTRLARLFFPPPPPRSSTIRFDDNDDNDNSATGRNEDDDNDGYADSMDDSSDESDDESDELSDGDVALLEEDDERERAPAMSPLFLPPRRQSSLMPPPTAAESACSRIPAAVSASHSSLPSAASPARSRHMLLDGMLDAQRRVEDLAAEVDLANREKHERLAAGRGGCESSSYSPPTGLRSSNNKNNSSSNNNYYNSSSPGSKLTGGGETLSQLLSAAKSPQQQQSRALPGCNAHLHQEVALATLLAHVVDQQKKVDEM